MYEKYFKITDPFKLQQRRQEERRAETTENRQQASDYQLYGLLYCFAKENVFTGFALFTYYY